MSGPNVNRIVPVVAPFSDSDETWLHRLAALCCEAHTAAPGGVTLEIGTRSGGSAATLAAALMDAYGRLEACPPLITCDPYGRRPYHDGTGRYDTDYGRDRYLHMRGLLVGLPFHAHFRLPSLDFLPILERCEWWEDGRAIPMRNVSFAFLDGEHDADTILTEARTVMAGLLPGGIIVADNVDHDPRTVPGLRELGDVELEGPWAILRRRG